MSDLDNNSNTNAFYRAVLSLERYLRQDPPKVAPKSLGAKLRDAFKPKAADTIRDRGTVISAPPKASFGKDQGSFFKIEERTSPDGQRRLEVELGNGVLTLERQDSNSPLPSMGIKPNTDSIKITIEGDAKGVSKLSAVRNGRELPGFKDMSVTDATKVIGEMTRRIAGGEVLMADKIADKLSPRKEQPYVPGQVGTFKVVKLPTATV